MDSTPQLKPHERILRVSSIARMLGVSKSTIYDWGNPRSPRFLKDFPPKIRIGNACTGFLESDVLAYIESRKGASQ